MKDYIDQVQEQWGRLYPGIGTEPSAVVGRISRLARIIQIRSDAVLASHGITRAEFDILSLLARTGRPMTPSELASDLLTSGAGSTKRIKKLVDSGLVIREANPEDGRGALVRMTEKAQGALAPILESVLEFEAGLLAPFTDADRLDLALHLRTLMLELE